jgi:regulator of RNase E activity RraA
MDSDDLLGLIPAERIRTSTVARPTPETVQAFRELPDMAGLVARAMDRIGIIGAIPAHVLSPLAPGQRIVGPAITVRNVPSRIAPHAGWQSQQDSQLGEREAYFVAQYGDVIVIDSGGRMLCSNLGPNSATLARTRGIAGAIVDGPITGPAGIRAVEFPVWSRGSTTLTGHHRVDTIEINGLAACASVQVAPGDLIVADESGISVVPQSQITDVLIIAMQLAQKVRALAQASRQSTDAVSFRTTLEQLTVGIREAT